MKHIQRLTATLVLTMALALSAAAGDMPLPGVVGPPPPPSTSVAGDMPTGVTATDPATDIFLNLLQSLLALF